MDIQKTFFAIAIFMGMLIPLSIFVVAPSTTTIPSDFAYSADIISTDNFYDEELSTFSGEFASRTSFYYQVLSKVNDTLLIKNTFDVRTTAGEKIFSVDRVYGVDPDTGQHAPGYGDHDRSGYLFGPKNLNKENFTYWHVNYDAPAPMHFEDEEEIEGLTVYRYDADYTADQTANLGHLPGVPETRGVILDINLQLWLEPVTGRLIKYEDHTTAWYYDIETGERLHPWNKFNNKYTEDSITKQVGLAESDLHRLLLYKFILPIVLAIVASVLLMISLIRGQRRIMTLMIASFLIIGTLIWFLNFGFSMLGALQVLIGTLVGTVFLGVLFSYLFSSPIDGLSSKFDQLSKGDFRIALEKTNIYEIQALTDSLNRVMKSMKLAMLESQRKDGGVPMKARARSSKDSSRKQ